MLVPLTHMMTLSFVLFSIGVAGVFIRKDVLTVFLCVELILNAANLAFVAVANAFGDEFGHVAVVTIIAIAAAEAAVGLSIVIKLHSDKKSMKLSSLNELRG
ncbi:MAG: NADH-quinone oxidoreductase subunit NuoK [Bdellovibrionales bacterium]|nr:NADH-quinone oxidoreductase subunit NuoK [Bdellovibrionales bacterium]